MTNKDIHIFYRSDTGNYVPDDVDPHNGSSFRINSRESLLEYIKWLEDNVIYLTQNF